MNSSLSNVLNQLIAEIAANRVPEGARQEKPENDEIWKRFENGPAQPVLLNSSSTTNNGSTMDSSSTTNHGLTVNHDNFVSRYIEEWFSAVLAIRNLLKMHNQLCKEYSLEQSNVSIPKDNLPPDYHILDQCGKYVLQSNEQLLLAKEKLMTLAEARKDWGSLDAFAGASNEQLNIWATYRQSNIDNLRKMLREDWC